MVKGTYGQSFVAARMKETLDVDLARCSFLENGDSTTNHRMRAKGCDGSGDSLSKSEAVDVSDADQAEESDGGDHGDKERELASGEHFL